jgi:hypothetical protein
MLSIIKLLSFVRFASPASQAKYIFIQDSTSSDNPAAQVGGGVLFVQSGALKWRSAAGIITTIAEA